ncbi:hypothetical protein FSP39_004897 [Pinctada imbricata]|uniref:B box-type domain-containing protein n=1 Tax=Pinctada imbricata TaxID=66713 RepID=A0AA88Y4X3_PINIB|nr:hypothetical protein FSP39_004897 [Pinctada imbricata]
MRKHEVVTRSRSVLLSHGTWKVREPCKRHKNNDLVTYCNDCKVPCCIDCMLEHDRHAFSKLETKYFEAESRLNHMVDNLSKSSLETSQYEIKRLGRIIDTCNENFNAVKAELKAAENKVMANVAQSFEKLRKNLSLKQRECVSNVEEKIEKCKQKNTEIENFIARIEQKIRTSGLGLMEYFPTLPTLPSFPSDISTPIPRFEFNEDILNECKTNLGQIRYKDRKGSSNQESMHIESERNEKIGHGSLEADKEKVSVPNIKIEKIGSFQTPIPVQSIEPVGDDTSWIARFGSDTMYLYDGRGREKRSVKIEGPKGYFWNAAKIGICDMSVQNNGDIVVTCSDGKVRLVSVDGKINTLIDTTPFRPLGVCLRDNEVMVVCMIGPEGDKNHVAVYKPDGKSKVREITARDGNNKPLITKPYRVVIGDNHITVLNYRTNVVSLDRHSGKVIWVYDGSQAKLKHKFVSEGICKDRFSNILVTDIENHCIHLMNIEGHLIKIIMLKDYGLEQPMGIGVDKRSGRIWCGNIQSAKIFIMKK